MGLKPRQPIRKDLKNWDDLQRYLDDVFTISDKNEHPHATVNTDDYKYSVEEIVAEGEKNGYKVTRNPGSPYLRFK